MLDGLTVKLSRMQQTLNDKILYHTTNLVRQQLIESVYSNITSSRLAAQSVSTNALMEGCVTKDRLALQCVSTVNISDGSVTSEKLAPKAISSYQLADLSVANIHVIDRAITSNKLAQGCVTSDCLALSSVSAIHLNNGAIISSKLDVGLSASNMTNLGTFTVTDDVNIGGSLRFNGLSNILGTTYASKIVGATLCNCDLSQSDVPKAWFSQMITKSSLPPLLTVLGSNLGIGVSMPKYALEVFGDIHATGSLITNGFKMFRDTSIETTFIENNHGAGWRLPDDNTCTFCLSNVGIGISNPSYQLEVKGTASFENITCSGNLSADNIVWTSNAATWASNIAAKSFRLGGTTNSNGFNRIAFPVGCTFNDIVHMSGIITSSDGSLFPIGYATVPASSSSLWAKPDGVYLSIPGASTHLLSQRYSITLMV